MPKYKTWITDPNPDEIRVDIEYDFSPAEPDVGCFSPWVEIESITDTGTNMEIELSSIEDYKIEEIEEDILASLSESSEIEGDYLYDCSKEEPFEETREQNYGPESS